MVVAKKFLYVKEFKGMPAIEDMQLVEDTLPELNDGEYLVEAVYLSVDPYMRAYPKVLGETMIGSQVAKIIESKSDKFPVGKYVVGGFGWTTHSIIKDDVHITSWNSPCLVSFEPSENLPISLALGVLGMPGNTAYFGFLDLCKPQPGETVVVSGAAGAVGSHVGQLAKIKGCQVIGIAGSDEKCEWLKSIGFDNVINYKTDNIRKALIDAAPKGIDCYFDNVGGEISEIVIDKMNYAGRVSICGSISNYNDKDAVKKILTSIARWKMDNPREIEIKAFQVDDFIEKLDNGIAQNAKWIEEGKLVYKETVTEGFENTMTAFIGILKGENVGKAIVKV